MKSIPDTIREVLIASGALTFDAGGELAFVGLTATESQFFVSFTRKDPEKRDPAEDLVFHQLRHRHVSARMRLASDGLE